MIRKQVRCNDACEQWRFIASTKEALMYAELVKVVSNPLKSPVFVRANHLKREEIANLNRLRSEHYLSQHN